MVYKVEISSESRQQAERILDALLPKRLVTGGQFIETPSRFLWKGEDITQNYCTVTSFTVAEHKDAVIREVEAASEEEVPMIVFIPFEPNSKLEEWIRKTCSPDRG